MRMFVSRDAEPSAQQRKKWFETAPRKPMPTRICSLSVYNRGKGSTGTIFWCRAMQSRCAASELAFQKLAHAKQRVHAQALDVQRLPAEVRICRCVSEATFRIGNRCTLNHGSHISSRIRCAGSLLHHDDVVTQQRLLRPGDKFGVCVGGCGPDVLGDTVANERHVRLACDRPAP